MGNSEAVMAHNTVEELLSVAYVLFGENETAFRNNETSSERINEFVSSIGILEIIVSFQNLRKDSRITVAKRKLIKSAIEVKNGLSKKYVMPLPGSGRRHTRVVGTVVQRHQKRDELCVKQQEIS